MNWLANIFSASFGKTMIVALMGGVVINGYLCFQNKVKEEKLSSYEQKLNQLRSQNWQLTAQIENQNRQIEQYQAQVKALHQNILDKMQQAESRTNEIYTQLQQVKNWRDQPIPSNIRSLLNQRSKNHSSNAATLPQQSNLSKTRDQHQNQR